MKLGPSDIGILQSGRQSRLDHRLAGEWYWEADSVYVPGADILLQDESAVAIDCEDTNRPDEGGQ